MAYSIYNNNDIDIVSERVDHDECKINVNGKNLIWISRELEFEFKSKLTSLLDEYRI